MLRIVGYACIALGVVLMLLCVPCWAWLALIGIAMTALGILLIRKK